MKLTKPEERATKVFERFWECEIPMGELFVLEIRAALKEVVEALSKDEFIKQVHSSGSEGAKRGMSWMMGTIVQLVNEALPEKERIK